MKTVNNEENSDKDQEREQEEEHRETINAAKPLEDVLKKRKSKSELKKIRKKYLRKFYENQNEIIDSIEKANQHLLLLHGSVDQYTEEEIQQKRFPSIVRLAIYVTLAVNIALFCAKLAATIKSGSLTVLASAIDSALDLLSGSIIFVTHWMMKRVDILRYPVGKSRYENLGIIVFAALMGSASFQVIIESLKKLLGTQADNSSGNDIFPIIVLACAIGAKILLYIWCKSLASISASCDALSEDHRNDVCTDSLTLILLGVIAKTGLWWLDPLGAIVLALFIIYNWVRTGHYHLTLLAGKIAEKKLTVQFTYFAANFDERILYVDTVRAYHSGLRLIVECDIILAPNITLKESHDIGESLQKGLELFDDVERAFVHCDYEFEHAPSKEHKSLF